MEPYVGLSTKYRTKAKIDFKKNYWKFFSNSVISKSIQNKKKHRDIPLVTCEKTRNRLAFSVNFKKSKYILEKKKNPPIFDGEKVLDFSEILTYEGSFHIWILTHRYYAVNKI